MENDNCYWIAVGHLAFSFDDFAVTSGPCSKKQAINLFERVAMSRDQKVYEEDGAVLVALLSSDSPIQSHIPRHDA